jgi:hypothetical protein
MSGNPTPDEELVRRRPLRAAMAALGCLLVCVAMGAGYSYWDFHRERIEYYRNFEKRWGVPVGVGGLRAEQVKHRRYTLKFHRRAGRVERVDVVNGHGQLTARHPVGTYFGSRDDAAEATRECSYIYRYDKQGQLTEERAQDRSGRIVFKFIYTSQDSAHFTDARGSTFAVPGSEASFVRFTLSDRGLEKEIRFYDVNGKTRRPDRDGTYGKRQELDNHGWPVRLTFLGPQDKPVLSRDGISGLTAKYDDHGNLIEQAYFGESGQPTPNKYRCAKLTVRYDDFGNATEQAYFDESGRPTRCSEGYAKLTIEYDDHGNWIEQAYFDESGQPTRHPDGNHKFTAKYDDRGNRIEMAYFDESDRPARHPDGNYKFTAKYDDRGRQIEGSFFDESGKLVRNKNGYARVVNTYDDRGNCTDSAYFDHEGEPVRCRTIIREIIPGGQAERIGLKAGDIVMTYDKKDVINMWRFIDAKRGERPAEKPEKELIILRDGKRLTFLVAPGPLQTSFEDRVVPETELKPHQDEKKQ